MGALEAIHMSRAYVCFITPVATIHYNKWSVVDSKKFEGHVYFRKAVEALLF